MVRSPLCSLSAALVVLGSTACGENPVNLVANGVSRLSVMQVAMITSLVNRDESCGFANRDVLASAELSGAPGTYGTATMRVTACDIDLGPAKQIISTDCNGRHSIASGKVTVTGTRIVKGFLTGDPTTPVIPEGADAVTVVIEDAELEHFGVHMLDSKAALVAKSGRVSAVVQPRLAASTMGLCTVPTPVATISNVRLHDVEMDLTTGGKTVPITVQASNLDAQNGRKDRLENTLIGSITIYGQEQQIPAGDDDGGLNPAYNAADFISSFSCNQELQQPLSHTCGDIVPTIAQGTARLSVLTMASLVQLVEKNEACGFASAAVKDSVVVTGELGKDGGSATWTIGSPCEISIPVAQPVSAPDCQGNPSAAVQGRFLVVGRKTVRGVNTGDPNQPVVPTSRDPAEVQLTALLQDFTVMPAAGNVKLTVVNGEISGTVRPRLAQDTTLGVCSVPTPVVQLSDIMWRGAQMKLAMGTRNITLEVPTSMLRAQVGSRDGVTNELTGNITLAGKQWPIPVSPDQAGLAPNYDQAAFDATWMCRENMRVPQSDEDCSIKPMLARNGARLVVLMMASVTRLINANEECGFGEEMGPGTLLEMALNAGEPFVLEAEAESCPVRHSLAEPLNEDCNHDVTYASGTALVTATRRLTLVAAPPELPRPLGREAADIIYENVRMQGMELHLGVPGAEDTVSVRMGSGTLSGRVHPILGESTETPGLFTVVTPVAGFHNVAARGLDVTLHRGPKTFHFTMDVTNLNAFNGSYNGVENTLSATVTIDGEEFNIESMPLVEDYNQAEFDQSYCSCNAELAACVPSGTQG
ncbi:MAG: hypothetical protein AB2A00_22680 [Myxococcota bacterium]